MMQNVMNRRWLLAGYPEGMPTLENWTLDRQPVPDPGPGQILELPNEEGHGDWVFTANGKQASGGRSRHKATIDEASGVSGWTVHDLRRTIPHEPCWRAHRPRTTLPGPCHRRGSRRP